MEHYFSQKPRVPGKDFYYTTTINNLTFKFHSMSSVFSKKRLDPGSRLLITESYLENAKRILDLGCGIGTIGIILKKLHPHLSLTLIDFNERAISLAKKNAKDNDVEVKIQKSNLYNKLESKFDAIICNPPQKAGKKVCIAIIVNAPKYLNKNGSLQIVARQRKGGKPLKEKMKEVFGNAKTIARKSGYQVYYSTLQT